MSSLLTTRRSCELWGLDGVIMTPLQGYQKEKEPGKDQK